MANLVLNILIIALLATTIGYCVILNRRIRILQDSKGELALLLKHFDESTQRASESIVALQSASKKIGENIQLRIEKANYLADDLAFMIEKGNKLVGQLDANYAISRARNKVMSEETVIQPKPPEPEQPPQPAKSDRLSALKEKLSPSLEAVLEKVAGRNKPLIGPAEDAPTGPLRPAEPPRSKAEQELLDMIKAGMKG